MSYGGFRTQQTGDFQNQSGKVENWDFRRQGWQRRVAMPPPTHTHTPVCRDFRATGELSHSLSAQQTSFIPGAHVSKINWTGPMSPG